MQRAEAQRKDGSEDRHAPLEYRRVVDGRKQPVRGLWIRGDRYYGQLRVEIHGKSAPRRVPLMTSAGAPCATVAEAKAALEKLKLRRDDDQLQVHDVRQAPTLRDFVPRYLEDVRQRKRPETYRKEEHVLKRWLAALGGRRLNAIRKGDLMEFRSARLQEGASPRTVNIDVIVMRQLLKYALDQDRIGSLPTVGLKALKAVSRKRDFVPPADIDRLISCVLSSSKNGRQVADYLLLLRYCGGREKEVIRLRWKDVDFERNQLVIGADGLSKNHESRVVDLNPALAAHLKAMETRRAPDSEWLFPSPQRGEQDKPAKTFRESMKLARKAAGMPAFGFHDLRHAFASQCVMAGIDFMTIARWLGHKDGGMLVGKVYGHLADEHRRKQAAKLEFHPKEAAG